MLQSLTIKNFALIEALQVDWTPGLNVLTGETGAGKSIVIDAISILLGAKAGPAFIRAGAEKAQIEAIFQLPSKTTSPVSTWLKEQELSDAQAGELTVAREISKSGSRFRINGTLVNQTIAQELRQFLISIQAQHEARTLLAPQTQLELLDDLGDKEHGSLAARLREVYYQKKEMDEQLKELTISEEERLRRLDFGRFQLTELNEAQIAHADEDSELAQQEQVLSNVATLASAAMSAEQALTGASHDGAESSQSSIDSIQRALSEVERASRMDSNFEPVASLLVASLADVEEAANQLRKYQDSLATDPDTLQAVESRIAELAKIKRKYGPSLAEALSRQKCLAVEIEQLENARLYGDELQQKSKALMQKLERFAAELSDKRKSLAQKLSKQIQSELVELGMERCRFAIAFDEQEDIGPNGKDRVEFMIAPNPGQPLMPLAKIASGGELSRVMLVIKAIFAKVDQVAIVVFDEIETGLSGRVLQAVRDKLAFLAKSHQILCITHQPVIAAVADNHLQIAKQHTDKTTKISVKVLQDNARLKTLAEMASGQDEEVALSFAKSLMNQAEAIRRS